MVVRPLGAVTRVRLLLVRYHLHSVSVSLRPNLDTLRPQDLKHRGLGEPAAIGTLGTALAARVPVDHLIPQRRRHPRPARTWWSGIAGRCWRFRLLPQAGRAWYRVQTEVTQG